jgi:hypothetical protein
MENPLGQGLVTGQAIADLVEPGWCPIDATPAI